MNDQPVGEGAVGMCAISKSGKCSIHWSIIFLFWYLFDESFTRSQKSFPESNQLCYTQSHLTYTVTLNFAVNARVKPTCVSLIHPSTFFHSPHFSVYFGAPVFRSLPRGCPWRLDECLVNLQPQDFSRGRPRNPPRGRWRAALAMTYWIRSISTADMQLQHIIFTRLRPIQPLPPQHLQVLWRPLHGAVGTLQ